MTSGIALSLDRASALAPRLSIVVPVFNEEGNIAALCAALRKSLDAITKLGGSYEVILVNDGSSDASMAVMREQASTWQQMVILDLMRNYGQTAALSAGIDHAQGDVVVTLDADLQNDPVDIPRFLDKLEQGYDVVCGWRKDRKDSAIRRNWLSRMANRLIRRSTGVEIHDVGCTFKAFRRETLEHVRFYGEMHRFIPIYAHMAGARIAEIPVAHHPRLSGVSKYGLERVVKVLLDLIVVRFLDRYLTKPIYLFGGFGLACFAFSFFILVWMLWLKFAQGYSMIATPLPTLSGMAFLLGAFSILQGLAAEIVSRTYFESQAKPIYRVRSTMRSQDRLT